MDNHHAADRHPVEESSEDECAAFQLKPLRQEKGEGQKLIAIRRQLSNVLGNFEAAFKDGLFDQLVSASRDSEGRLDLRTAAFVASVIRGVKPKDQLEATAAAQMALVHMAFVRLFPNLAQAGSGREFVVVETSLNKLARTSVAQMEAFHHHRNLAVQYAPMEASLGGKGRPAEVPNATRNPTKKSGMAEKPAAETSPPQDQSAPETPAPSQSDRGFDGE